MKARITFIDTTAPPLYLHGETLGMYEIGGYTNIKDYSKKGHKIIASVATNRVLYIEYTDESN